MSAKRDSLPALIEAIRTGRGYWYVEARVGRDNFRGDELRLVHDRRGESLAEDESEYSNRQVEEGIREIVAALFDASWKVHNHGPEDGSGVACREFDLNGKLIGECLIRKLDIAVRTS